jgi:hypothetical protein
MPSYYDRERLSARTCLRTHRSCLARRYRPRGSRALRRGGSNCYFRTGLDSARFWVLTDWSHQSGPHRLK